MTSRVEFSVHSVTATPSRYFHAIGFSPRLCSRPLRTCTLLPPSADRRVSRYPSGFTRLWVTVRTTGKKRDLGGRLGISQAVFFSTLEFRSVSLGVRNLGCDPQYPHPAGLSPIVSGYRFQPHPPLSCLPDCPSPAGRTRPG